MLRIPKKAANEYHKALESLKEQDRPGAIRHLEKAVELAIKKAMEEAAKQKGEEGS